MSSPLFAVQVDAAALVDEGAGPILDTIQNVASADCVFLTGFTMNRETGGGVAPGDSVFHHRETEWTGGNYAEMHHELYCGTILGPVGRATEFGNLDIFRATIPAAHERGMRVYDFIDESAHAPALRSIPGFLGCLEVDIWNKPARRPCYNNPDYREWHLAIVADHVLSHNLDGLCWRSGRISPLDRLLIESTPQGMGVAVCWCDHCRAKAADRGLDWRRAQEGYRRLVSLNASVGSGEIPNDGVFATFWRLLTVYPEIFGWQALWIDGQTQLYRDIFGTVRAIRPKARVGFAMPQLLSFSPFHRAVLDFSSLSHVCDYVLLTCHLGIGGMRLRRSVDGMCHAIFGDTKPGQLHSLLCDMMGPLAERPGSALSSDHVSSEVQRVLRAGEGRCDVYVGIDVDIPASGSAGSFHDSEMLDLDDEEPGAVVVNNPARAVQAAIGAGAAGIVLGRKYSEMTVDTLRAATAQGDQQGV